MPQFLQFHLGVLGVPLPGFQPLQERVNCFNPYDQYLQKVEGLNNNTVELVGLPKHTPYTVDFEGWIRQPIKKEEEISELRKRFYWEDCVTMEGTRCTRIFMLWRIKDQRQGRQRR